MNSSGVPTQGIVVQEATTAKKRGDRSMGHPNNYVGKGTAGRNLKRRHRRHMMTTHTHLSLKMFAEALAATPTDGATKRLLEDITFAEKWLEGK